LNIKLETSSISDSKFSKLGILGKETTKASKMKPQRMKSTEFENIPLNNETTITNSNYIHEESMVKFTLEQAMKTQTGGGG
jgi:hypothetical protein